MGLFQGSATISRYKVVGDLPPDFADFCDERIRRFAFLSIEETTDELAAGWVSAADFLDTDFSHAAYALDPYVVLGLRVDRRKLSGALVRKYFRLEMQKALAMMEGDARLSRSRREELKEKARMDLLKRIPPASQAFDVCWNTVAGDLWLGSATGSVREIFEDLFRRSFELELKPVIPWSLAQGLLAKTRAAEQLEDAGPLSLYAGEE